MEYGELKNKGYLKMLRQYKCLSFFYLFRQLVYIILKLHEYSYN